MNIGLDFGDVIVDKEALKRSICQRIFNISTGLDVRFNRENLVGSGLLTNPQYNALQQLVYNVRAYAVDEAVPVSPNTVHYIKRLQGDGHKLFIISKRDDDARRLAEDWLESKRLIIPFYSVGYVERGVKADVCKELSLDLFLDNDLNELIPLDFIRYRFLFLGERLSNVVTPNDVNKIPKDFVKVFSWAHFYDEIQRLS